MSDNDNGPKIVSMPEQKNELAAAGDNLRRNFDTLIQNQGTIARLRRAAFLSYVEAGFSEPQALELCCK